MMNKNKYAPTNCFFSDLVVLAPVAATRHVYELLHFVTHISSERSVGSDVGSHEMICASLFFLSSRGVLSSHALSKVKLGSPVPGKPLWCRHRVTGNELLPRHAFAWCRLRHFQRCKIFEFTY